VNARKQRLASLPKVLNFSIMDIAIEFPVGVQTIRANRASQLNIILNEAVEGFSIKVLDKAIRMRPILLPSASAATTINTLLKVFRPVAPPNSALPQ
jgi:hypothetical protein